MFSDPQFWVAIAFILFILAIFKPVKNILRSSLDAKINEIKENIEEAENLRNDTQVTLSEIKKRKNEVELEIKEIHLNSKDRIKILETQAQEKLIEQGLKRKSLTEAKIEQMSRDANLLIQDHITQTAINATAIVLEKKMNKEDKQNLINLSIQDLNAAIKN